MAPRQLKTSIKEHFIELTLASLATASKFLDAHGWNLDSAAAAFFNSQPSPDPKVVAIFDKYRSTENPDVISIDGTLAYLEDLNLDPEDPISLTLAYVLESPQTGEFRRDPFVRKWLALSVNTLEDMRKHVVEKHRHLSESVEEFEPFYQFVFEFVRGADPRIKTIPHDEAIVYWQMLLDPRFPTAKHRLASWYKFIDSTGKHISRDSWNMFLKFLVQVVVPDPQELSAYDEMSAWPSIIDEYVEWIADN